MDELSVDEGDISHRDDTNVGHVPGECHNLSIHFHILTGPQAEGTDAFSQFHLYVCSALLVKFSDRLREMDFQVGIRLHYRLRRTDASFRR